MVDSEESEQPGSKEKLNELETKVKSVLPDIKNIFVILYQLILSLFKDIRNRKS